MNECLGGGGMPTIGGGEFDRGGDNEPLRTLFLAEVDQVVPEVHREASGLGEHIANHEGTGPLSDLSASLLKQAWNSTPVDLDALEAPPDAKEAWRRLLSEVQSWADRWKVYPWMWTAGLWAAVCRAKGWTYEGWAAEWTVLRLVICPPQESLVSFPESATPAKIMPLAALGARESPPNEHVDRDGIIEYLKLTAAIDLTTETISQAVQRVSAISQQRIPEGRTRALLKEHATRVVEAGLSKAKEIYMPGPKQSSTPLELRLQWVALRRFRNFSWAALDKWTRVEYPTIVLNSQRGIARNVNELTRLLED